MAKGRQWLLHLLWLLPGLWAPRPHPCLAAPSAGSWEPSGGPGAGTLAGQGSAAPNAVMGAARRGRMGALKPPAATSPEDDGPPASTESGPF